MKATTNKGKEAARISVVLAVLLAFSLAMAPLLSYTPSARGETTQNGQEQTGIPADQPEAGGKGTTGEGNAAPGTDIAGAPTTDPAGEDATGKSSPQPQPQQNGAEATALGGGIGLQSVQSGGDKLQVMFGDAQTGWQDIDDLHNATAWSLYTYQKQVQIRANFADVGTAKSRTIEVNIPKGMKILEYSAKSGTSAIANVTQLQLSSENDPKLASSALTAADGTPWASQAVTGYNNYGAQTPSNYRTYDGKILYTFNSNCDQITLTLTLGLDQRIMPHNATSTTLSDLTVKMASGSTPLSTHLTTTVKDLLVPTIGSAQVSNYGNRIIEGDPDTGAVNTFITGFAFGMHSSAVGGQTHYADSNTITFSYPDGATFQGFIDRITGTNKSTDPSGGVFANGHLQVINDPDAHTVTFIYDKVTMQHSSSGDVIDLYWTADMHKLVNGTWNGEKKPIVITPVMKEISGAASNNQQAHNPNGGSVTITVAGPFWDIKLLPSNRTRYDLNAADDFPYEYLLGSINVTNVGPSSAPDLTYTWVFDPNLAVRAVTFPGFDSATNTIHDVSAKVDGPNGSRTITLTGQTFNASKTVFTGIAVRAENFGLAPGEYLTEVVAKQSNLDAYNYQQTITACSASYYGRWQGGQTGDAVLTITDDHGFFVSTTDHTSKGRDKAGAGTVQTTAKKADGSTGSFYPTDPMLFTSTFTSGTVVEQQNDIVDPTIIISLPKGIEIDQNSVKGISKAGNHSDGSSFNLDLVDSSTMTIDGVEWTIHKYTSVAHQDMIAQGPNVGGANHKSNEIAVTFTANVSSACGTYPELKAKDLVAWDLGATAVNCSWGTDFTMADTYNKAGHGTTYRVAAGTTNTELHVVQKPGLTVSLGIRTVDSGTSFYTYDGTAATIAPVTPDHNAEIQVTYTNTSDSAYFPGSEIYLPIPKKGLQYASFFSNKAADPYNQSDNVNPQYSTYLEGTGITLPGFKTYYAFDTSGNVNGGAIDDNWTPVSYTFYPAGSFPAGKHFPDVTMVKFVADAEIPNGKTGTTVFEASIDQDAVLGQTDFWRSYQKGWRTAGDGTNNGEGTWIFGSVLAAEPAKAGIAGFVFDDANLDGIKQSSETGYSGGQITARLSEKSGGIQPLFMTVNADGSFASLNANGTPYHLKAGEYVVTIMNSDPSQYFTTTTTGTSSVPTAWHMDIAQANIQANQASATYEFSVTTGTSLSTEYLGVGMKTASTVTYAAGTGITNWPSPNPSEYVRYNNAPASIPVIDATNTVTGYNPTAQKWTLDKAVTLKDGTAISAGTVLTRAQLANVKVTENLVATVALDPITFTVSVSVVGNKGGTASATPATVNYGSSSVVATSPATGYELDYIQVNGGNVTAESDGSYTIANIQENKTVLVKFKPIEYSIAYNLDGGSVATSNPATYNIETPQFTLNNPTKAGYIFTGWTGTGLGTTPPYTTNVTVGPNATGDRAYTAHWQARTDTPYDVEHYWQQSDGSYDVHETDHETGTTGATATAIAKQYDYYTENTTHTDRVPSATIKGDGTTVLKLYYDKTIFDLTFDSQGANEAATLDVLSLRVSQDTVIASASGFPKNPTKPGYVFRGWKMPDMATWVTSSTLMPAEDTKLTAVWEPGTVIGDGEITIIAYNFAMSLSEAQVHQAKLPPEQLAELIARGQAKAWWTDSKQDVSISYVQVKPSKGDGKSIDAAPGDYYVTYFAADQGKTAQVTVLATVYGNLAPGSGIGGNNFTYNIAGGPLSEDQIRAYGKVTVYDKWGNKTNEGGRINAADHAYINNLINAGQTGDVPVRFTNAAGDVVTIIVTLVRDPLVPPGGGITVVYGPIYNVVYPVAQTLQNVSETLIGQTPTPLAIDDNETPLAGNHFCWVHFYMIAGIVLTLVYGVAVVIRRRKFTNDLEDFEDSILGGSGSAPSYGAPSFDQSMRQGSGA